MPLEAAAGEADNGLSWDGLAELPGALRTMKATRFAAATAAGCAFVASPLLAQGLGEFAAGGAATIPEIASAIPPPAGLVEPAVVGGFSTLEPGDGKVIAGASAPVSAAWSPAPAGPSLPLDGSAVVPGAFAAVAPSDPSSTLVGPEPLVAGAGATAPVAVAEARPAIAPPSGPAPIVTTQPAPVVHTPTVYVPPPPAGGYVGSIASRSAWTGFYIGASASAAWADVDVNQTRNPPFVGPETSSFSAAANGAAFGLLAGHDWQVTPTVVAGLFASYEFNSTGFFFTANPAQGWGVELGDVWTIAGRAGWLISPRVLLYGLVGFSGSEVALSYNDTTPIPNLTYAGTDWVGGITAGLGVEAMFGRHFSARLEYRFTNFGTARVGGSDPPTAGTTTADIVEQSLRGAIVYRFGDQ